MIKDISIYRRISICAAIALLLMVFVFYVLPRLKHPGTITTIAFGSCNQNHYAQPIWPAVLESQPDVWIWAGDNIYADHYNVRRHQYLYNKQRRHPLYRQLMQRSFITGVWDDHDYGLNGAGIEYPGKEQSQQAFLDFLGVGPDDPRRKQAGIYHSHVFGPKGQRLQILLLDVRYHRQPPGESSDILGPTQWAWLEKQFREVEADLTLLVTGTTVMPREFINGESWQQYPGALKRLNALIAHKANPVIILAGDLHYGEILRMDSANQNWPLYEFVSSGMTHAANRYRGKNPYRVGRFYTSLNYGRVMIDWGRTEIGVTMQIMDTDNTPRTTVREQFIRPTHPVEKK